MARSPRLFERVRRRWKWWVGGALAATAGAVGLVGCGVNTPLRGPGIGPGRLVRPQGVDEVVVGITHATLGESDRSRFREHSRYVVEQLNATPGFIGFSIRFTLSGDEIWTMTVWRDEAALDAFVASRVHTTAIDEGLSAVRQARFLRFTVPADQPLPTWSQIIPQISRVEPIDY